MNASASLPASAPAARRGGGFGAVLPWLLLALLAAFPLIAPHFELEYYVGFVRRLLIVMIAATSLNFILGYGGMVALGHAGFLGVGAYTVVALVDAGFSSAWLAWGAALVVTAAFATLIGAVSLRTRGVYFIMITLAFAQMLYYLGVSLRTYGGDDGYGIYTPLSLGGWLDAQPNAFYWAVLALAALIFALGSRLAVSRFGLALMGIRDNETRMAALGFPVFRLRLVAFAGAGAVAGLAGALLASHNGFVSPSMMHWTESAILIVMVVIGGMGNRWGGVIGVGLWLTLEEVLKMYTEYWHWPLGLLLIAIVFFAPRGLAALFGSKGERA
ncbi:branched-chain amino acid ABC transporter permease [Azoarcus indigens]|uniref:Amino acid/amide ABC transporter membrane protein 2 (HAAT family) n=1 Tax=Azoarcus indigens TaxID=29545 RepID=A0A4R6E180_9RHOO|nr:branched-chain amino acid ABC transporter permease [Azoarcus indigens]NMG67763.1 branched-chain amino acid ABC transporter permease [Azoarcus indigens]TDN51461.1 amino acid/amide ABC transporter membrane protein 2 (HAAT family) [Azoarcus indigens]